MSLTEGPFHKSGCLCTDCLYNIDECVKKIASCPHGPPGSYLWDSSLTVTLRECMPYDSFHQSKIMQRYVDSNFRPVLEKLLLFSIVYRDHLVESSTRQQPTKTESKVRVENCKDGPKKKKAVRNDKVNAGEEMRGNSSNKSRQGGDNHQKVDRKVTENILSSAAEKGDIRNEGKLAGFGKSAQSRGGGGDLSEAADTRDGRKVIDKDSKLSLKRNTKRQLARKRSYIKMRQMGEDWIVSYRLALLERFSMMCTYGPAAAVLARYTPEIWPWLHGFMLDLADETETMVPKKDHLGCPSCSPGAFGLRLYSDGGVTYLLHDVIVLTERDDLVRALLQETGEIPSFSTCIATILRKRSSFRVLWMALRTGLYFLDIGGIMGYKVLREAGALPAVLTFIERARGWKRCAFVKALLKWAMVLRMFLDGTMELHYFRRKSVRVRLQMDEGDEFYSLRNEMYEVQDPAEGVMPVFCSNPPCMSFLSDKSKRLDGFRTCRYCKLAQYCSAECHADHWHTYGPDGHMSRCFSRDMLVSNCKNLD
ncbi:uncharacterized protein LOC118420869 [Branchiostoma floridae]|uniref:Uncharacterized protein LOC118420869 n=1 Tax=Branchiostoma floridae TaxID=7739 RepID=A0A9J7LJS8_BRAFL|nr:uncharacterized protein LOC118420869 [Branchiostoma floridae]